MNDVVKDIAERAVALIDQKKPFAITAVITQTGSTPRDVGAMMLVEEDRSIVGTVGGGLLESAVQDKAVEVIRSKTPHRFYYNLDTAEAGGLGMICGGETEVFIDYIDAGESLCRAIYQGIIDAFQSNQLAWLGFHVPDENGSQPDMSCRQCLLTQDGTAVGAFLIDEDKIEVGKTRFQGYDVFTVSEKSKIFLMCVGSEAKAIVFGAGHVSEKLAPLLSMVGFRTTVMDDRGEFANKKRFPGVDEIVVVDSFRSGIFNAVSCDENTYLVIVTRGHSFDREVLEQALRTPARYIGMIGSRTKRDATYQYLLKHGFTAKDIDRVHAPIGLDIKSETPEEIAVSIVAEMILVRRS